MEKIRGRAEVGKSLENCTAKMVRMGMADRRHSLDIQDKSVLRSCLDTLQSNMSVRSVGGMSDRLESLARQMNLKFMVHSPAPSQHSFYISTETFYVEMNMSHTGAILETKIHHQNPGGNSQHSTQPAPQISDCLSQGDFSQVREHLQGLLSVYDMPDCSPVDKSRAWQALYTLEQDLSQLGGSQAVSQHWELQHLIHTSGLGLLQPRAGGIPMRLTYFLPPYHLLDPDTGTLLPCTRETVVGGKKGLVARVGLHTSPTPYLLPLTTLLSVNKEQLPISQANSLPLPAHFCLTLDHPLPLSAALAKIIASITSIEWVEESKDSPLLSLITLQASDGSLDPSNNRGLFVTLPDQQHCYFLTETPSLVGQLVDMIPFRHPGQVPSIIEVLRRQATFNTLIASCVRPNSLEDVDTSLMFEVTCVDPSCATLTITFEHPVEEAMATAELKLGEVLQPRCRVYTAAASLCSEELANKVLAKSLSIPVTMRTLIARGRGFSRHAYTKQQLAP